MSQRLVGIFILFLLVSFAGCGDQLQKSPEKARQEAGKMQPEQIESKLARLESESLKTRQEIEILKEKVKTLSVQDLFGPQGEKLKEKLRTLKAREENFMKQQTIYMEVLHSKQP